MGRKVSLQLPLEFILILFDRPTAKILGSLAYLTLFADIF